jgi:recombination associated protein RdgC
MSGELAKMLADLVEALGGEADVGAPAPRPAVNAAPAKGHEPVRTQRVVLELNGQAPGTVPPGDGSANDPLYDQAVEVVRTQQRASISLVQRHLRVGYNRAARLIEAMEVAGVIKGTQGIYTVSDVTGAAA